MGWQPRPTKRVPMVINAFNDEYDPTIAPVRQFKEPVEQQKPEKPEKHIRDSYVTQVNFKVNELENLKKLLGRFVEWNKKVAAFEKPEDRIIDIASEVEKALEHLNIMRTDAPSYSLSWEEVSGVDDNLQVKFDKKYEYLDYRPPLGYPQYESREDYALQKYKSLIRNKKVKNVKLHKRYNVSVELVIENIQT